MSITIVDSVKGKELIALHKGDSSFVVLDVRTMAEREVHCVAGSCHIDIHAFDFADSVNKLDRSKTYLVHCKVGGRAMSAAELMVDMGFENVMVVKGSLF